MTTRFTRADYELLPEGFPAELIEGQLLREAAPNYGHQIYVQRLLVQLVGLVGDRAVPAPIDVGIDNWNVFQPDVVVLADFAPLEDHDVGIPLLAIEVLSPSTARRDKGVKRRRLLAAGVKEVWIVDPAAKTVDVQDASGLRSATGDERLASRIVAGFEVVPTALFAPTRG